MFRWFYILGFSLLSSYILSLWFFFFVFNPRIDQQMSLFWTGFSSLKKRQLFTELFEEGEKTPYLIQ